MNNWTTVEITGGEMRRKRGLDIENFVINSINRIGKVLGVSLVAKKGYLDKKELKVGNVCKLHQVDVHVYVNEVFVMAIECKSYLDSCYYTRACDDFKLFRKFGYYIKNYIFCLEDSLKENTLKFTDYITDEITDGIFILLDGKRSSSKPIFKKEYIKNTNLKKMIDFVNIIWELCLPKIPNENLGSAGNSYKVFKLIKGDCLAEMTNIKEKSIDLIVCDLPYGVTKNKWDIIIPFDKLWEQYNRIIKDNGAIVLFASQPFTTKLISSNYKDYRYNLVWEKNKFSDFLNAKRKPMKINEDICIFYKKQPVYNIQYVYGKEPYKRWNTESSVLNQTNYNTHKTNVAESKDGKRLPTTILKFNRIERPDHPTQKPVDLLEWLIKTYSNEGDLVLDNCMGVGSTGVACKNLNRQFIGIEIEEVYFNVAKTKMNQPLQGKHR